MVNTEVYHTSKVKTKTMRTPKTLVNTEYLTAKYKVSRQLLNYYRKQKQLETVKVEDSEENFYNLDQAQSVLREAKANYDFT